jgi:hypothetical protein
MSKERGFNPMLKNLKIKTLTIFILFTVFSLPAFAAKDANSGVPFFVDPKMPTEVQAAHESFLAGNFDQMALDIKRALMAHPGDESIQRNLLDLYDKAYEIRGDGAINPDWHAPKEILWFSIGVKKMFRPDRGLIDYRMSASLDFSKGSEIEQLRIVHFPSEVIIDKAQGIGMSFDEISPDGINGLWIGADYRKQPISEGLYLLDIKMKGKETTHGWFLLSRIIASESPEVSVPAINQTFSTGNPSFQWKNFVSSQYRNYEQRGEGVNIIRYSPNVTSNTWTINHRPATLTSVTVGAGNEGETGAKTLAPDDYVFQLTYRERHKFGDLLISRDSGTHVPFTVK